MLVLYQRKVQGNFRTQYLPATKDSKSRTLSPVPTCQTLLEFSRQKSKNKMSKVHVEPEDFICSSENINVLTAKILDLAWLFARVYPMKQFEVSLQRDDKQTIPGWHAFNAIVSSPYMPDITTVGYCPLIPASPTEYSTVYTVMKTVQNLMKALNQAYSVITFDEAIYCKAKEIQWQRTDEFSDTILRLGGFHTVLNFMAVIGKRYEDSGLEDLLIESGLYGSNTVKRIVEGKVYSKGIRAMKQVTEALSRVRLSTLAEYLGPQ